MRCRQSNTMMGREKVVPSSEAGEAGLHSTARSEALARLGRTRALGHFKKDCATFSTSSAARTARHPGGVMEEVQAARADAAGPDADAGGEECAVCVCVHIRPLIEQEALEGCQECLRVTPGQPQARLAPHAEHVHSRRKRARL